MSPGVLIQSEQVTVVSRYSRPPLLQVSIDDEMSYARSRGDGCEMKRAPAAGRGLHSVFQIRRTQQSLSTRPRRIFVFLKMGPIPNSSASGVKKKRSGRMEFEQHKGHRPTLSHFSFNVINSPDFRTRLYKIFSSVLQDGNLGESWRSRVGRLSWIHVVSMRFPRIRGRQSG